MFKALMKVQLASVIASLTRSSKGNEKRSAASGALIAVLFVFVAGVLVFAFGAMFYALAAPMHSVSLDWFYFAMAALTAFALCFIGSVFTAQQQLFSARDNELLLAMPIKPKLILGSRMVMLLAIDYALELLVMAPAAVIWGVQVGYSAAGVAALVVGILLLPLLVLTFTCIIAWVLAAVSSRMRNKTIVTMVLYLAFLAAYFYVYMNFNNILTGLIANSVQLAGGVAVVYPVYAFGQAIAAGNLLHMAGFAACCAVPFAIVYAVLSRGFLSVTMRRPAAKKLVYREQKLAVSSASGALLKKELRHFGANGMYILNASLGSILTIAAAVALIIYRDTLVTVLGELPQGWTAAFMTIALCFLCATDVISASRSVRPIPLLKRSSGSNRAFSIFPFQSGVSSSFSIRVPKESRGTKCMCGYILSKRNSGLFGCADAASVASAVFSDAPKSIAESIPTPAFMRANSFKLCSVLNSPKPFHFIEAARVLYTA